MEECIRSMTPGRVRVRHEALKNAGNAEKVQNFLEAKDGVRGAAVNPRTGSLLLEYDPDRIVPLQLLAFVEELQQIFGIDFSAGAESGAEKQTSCLLGNLSPREMENRGMLITLGASVACILAKRGAAHAAFGWVFLALSALHLVRYRRCL